MIEYQDIPQSFVYDTGPVNIIGETTDYNDGLFVIAMAVPLGKVVVDWKISGKETFVYTTTQAEDAKISFNVDNINKVDPLWWEHVNNTN